MYWSSEQVAYQFYKSQSANKTFDHYERLSQDAYRYFKQQMDRLITGSSDSYPDLANSKHLLLEAMQALRDDVVENPAQDANVRSELERVANLTAFLEASDYRFKEIEQLRSEGKLALARQNLSKYSNEEIDSKFQPMVDSAISAERKKAAAAKQELQKLLNHLRWFAIFAVLAAAIFSLIAGKRLLDRVSKPVEALMQGTDEIALGNLSYRIEYRGKDEFAYLAGHFNRMAQVLESQQEKLRLAQAELEVRVARRTFELQHANQELTRMDTERRELLADISHELRTPITVIRGEAEVTLRGNHRDIADYKDALQRISELSMQLAKYVNDLLFLARTEIANLQFEWDTFDLNELLASSTEDMKVMAQDIGLNLSNQILSQPIWVQGDKQRLRQLLFILGDNACRYSKPESEICIRSWLEDKHVKISVSDHGIGIPQQDLKRVFDRHFRSENARNFHGDGSGLGLPLAKSIIKAHGGQITVDSVENQGSTFTISLPYLFEEDVIA